ncbi:hypothetical protein [Streptomyces swartbergensis]|uniref:Uncharacterized protein n=1 Tax=Streptomyces swartbergensis TaxID=487165 RepID=A0A243S728_9ACTN|nr:hypothetical protein [Streptomyces swartbergensis]OUD03370.1 hypothetical protein CA983_10190 [Streptomyces swartbergensis]
MTDYPEMPFWVEQRAKFLAEKSASADPSACGTCRSNAEDGNPVKHDECQQRATLLHAPDHPHYELLAGFSLEENAKLPARFHVPVFDDCGVPNSWLCAVCWEDGVVTGWPCATATKYGTKVFTPLGEAETAQEKQAVELASYRALELGHPDGRVSASCGNPEHPTWLRAPSDSRACPWCEIERLKADAGLCSDCGHVERAHSEDGETDCTASGARVRKCTCSFFIPGGGS